MPHQAPKPPTDDPTETSSRVGSGVDKIPMQAIESASFVALVTAIFYFMGYSYYAGFFERLSLPAPFPELSTSDYFLQAFSSLDAVIAAALVSIPYRAVAPTTIGRAMWVNSAFVITPLLLAENARSEGFLHPNLALFLFAVAAVGVIASLLKRSIVKVLTTQWGFAGAISYAFGFLLFFSLYFRAEGAADDTRLIEGRFEPSVSIVLHTRDAASPINGQRLLVALMRDGFYLVQRESPAPEVPEIYFVPESEVASATMRLAEAAAPGS